MPTIYERGLLERCSTDKRFEIYALLTEHEVKMAGYWPSSFFFSFVIFFFSFLWT